MQMAVMVASSVGMAGVIHETGLLDVTPGVDKLSLDIVGAALTRGDVAQGDDSLHHAMAVETDIARGVERAHPVGPRLTDVVSIEPDILRQILDCCGDRDVRSAAATCSFMWRRCQRELQWRQALWEAAHLEPRVGGQCRTAEYPVDLEQLMAVGRLVDEQRDATSTDSALSASTLERVLRTGGLLRHRTHLYDVVYVTEATSLSKISLIALRSERDDGQLCFHRLLWRSAHGQVFHLFPKQVHDVAERHGYWQYFAPYFETNCRRAAPCYAVLPESSAPVRQWLGMRPLDSKDLLPRQQLLLGMFPVHRVDLVVELCACTRGMSVAQIGVQQRSRPRLITPARFYSTQPQCTAPHNTLWWI